MRFLRLKRHWLPLVAGMFALATIVSISGIFPWSPLNCWQEEIDIHSGRVRQTRHLLYCQIAERIDDTWLSRAIDSPGKAADWHRVNTFSPGTHHSPHHRYHGALNQVQTLETLNDSIPFEREARQQVATTMCDLWQSGGSSRAAGQYLGKVGEVASKLHQAGAASLKVSDLPAP